MKVSQLKNIIKEEIIATLNELDIHAYIEISDKLKQLNFKDALSVLYKEAKLGKITDAQFRDLASILISRSSGKSFKNEGVITEMSIRQIKERIKEVLNSDEVQQYKIDNFNFENIPLSVFEENGITQFHLKQYDMSNDIITYDLGININPIKKTVDVFLQKEGMFDQ